MLNQWERLRLVIVTYWSHNSGFPTIASMVHHVKPMGASTAGDCNSRLVVHHVKPMGASTAGDCNLLESQLRLSNHSVYGSPC